MPDEPVLGDRVGFLVLAEPLHAGGQVAMDLRQQTVDDTVAFQQPGMLVDSLVIEILQPAEHVEAAVTEDDAVLFERGTDHIHHERVDDLSVGAAQAPLEVFRDVPGRDETHGDGVLDVPAEVGDLVRDAHHTTLIGQRRGLAAGDGLQVLGFALGLYGLGERLPAMGDNAVAHGIGQVEAAAVVRDAIHHGQAVHLVNEPSGRLGESRQRPLPDVAERRVAQIMAERDGLRQLHVEPQSLAYGRGNGRYVEYVLDAGADVVVLGKEKNLGLVLQPPEGSGVDDSGLVPEIVAPDVRLARFHARVVETV